VFARAGQNIVFALADGVGDEPGAARAARVAASSAARSPVLDGPVAAVLAAQRAVRALDGSGDCVLVVAMPFGDGAGFRIAWVGDARAYSWTGDVLTPLTSDHTLAQYFRDHGEPVTPHMEHMVTTSVRTAAAGEIGTVEGPGGGLLLTSDGVHKALHLATMRDVLARPGRTAVALVETAIALGGSDNATVILAEPTGCAAERDCHRPAAGHAEADPRDLDRHESGSRPRRNTPPDRHIAQHGVARPSPRRVGAGL
jgi:protein phosphatase